MLANLVWMFCAEVEPVTEQSFLPLRVSGPVMSVLSVFTSRSWPATKYGPAKETFCLRLSLIVYVAIDQVDVALGDEVLALGRRRPA